MFFSAFLEIYAEQLRLRTPPNVGFLKFETFVMAESLTNF